MDSFSSANMMAQEKTKLRPYMQFFKTLYPKTKNACPGLSFDQKKIIGTNVGKFE